MICEHKKYNPGKSINLSYPLHRVIFCLFIQIQLNETKRNHLLYFSHFIGKISDTQRSCDLINTLSKKNLNSHSFLILAIRRRRKKKKPPDVTSTSLLRLEFFL